MEHIFKDSKLKAITLCAATALLVFGCDSSGGSSSGGGASTSNGGQASLNFQPSNGCLSKSACLVGLSGSSLHVTGSNVGGNVVLLGGAPATITGGGSINSYVYSRSVDDVNELDETGTHHVCSVIQQDFTDNEGSVRDFLADLEHMTPTQTFATIDGTTEITGDGAVNVIKVSGGITLTGTDTLTFNGSASDQFIVLVEGGDINVSAGASIKTAGGVSSRSIIFVIVDSHNVQLSSSGKICGTFVSNHGGSAGCSGSGDFEGAIFSGGSIEITGGGTFTASPFCPGESGPAPAPIACVAPSPTPSAIPSPRPTPTHSATPCPTPSPTPTPTHTATPCPAPTHTAAPCPVPTHTPCPLPSHTPCPLPSHTQCPVPTHTPCPTHSPTPSPSVTATSTPTPSPSVTATSTPTPSPSVTATSTPTPSPSVTATSTPTPSPTPSDTATPEPSESPSPSPSPSPSTPTPVLGV